MSVLVMLGHVFQTPGQPLFDGLQRLDWASGWAMHVYADYFGN